MGMTRDGLSHWQAETEGATLLEMTLGDLLDQRAEEIPSQEAVVYSGYPEFGSALALRWTYQQYREQADLVARGLIALGLRKGEHIAVWAANVPEWLLLFMAAAKAGLVLVTVNPALRASEVEYILKQGDVAALFFMAQIRDHNCLATMQALTTPGSEHGRVRSEALPALRYLGLIGVSPAHVLEHADWRPGLFREIVVGGAGVSVDELRARQSSIVPADPLMILYTSGTTGFPKGAVLTHRGTLNDMGMAIEQLRAQMVAGDRFCLPMPFFHIAGAGIVVVAIAASLTLHPLLAFEPARALTIITQEQCSLFIGVPTMLIAMLQHPDFSGSSLSCLKAVIATGAPVPADLMRRVKESTGADITIIFGQTEATGAITTTLPADSFELKAATVGIPIKHVEVKIIDPVSGEIVACGERGELCCHGFLTMQGYYKMPEKTAAAIDSEGWLHSGDLAIMDERGYIQIVGRLKEMVIRGGENIFPREIEEFLARHPQVSDVQIVGVPDAFFGEELLAVVLPRPGQQVTEEELRGYCQGQISHQKIPRYFHFVETYPMTATGKVQKFVLREQAIRELGLS